MTHDPTMSRRNFIATSVGGLATVGLGALPAAAVFAQEQEGKPAAPEGEIIYRTLGRTGMRVPIVSMGVMNANAPFMVVISTPRHATSTGVTNRWWATSSRRKEFATRCSSPPKSCGPSSEAR